MLVWNCSTECRSPSKSSKQSSSFSHQTPLFACLQSSRKVHQTPWKQQPRDSHRPKGSSRPYLDRKSKCNRVATPSAGHRTHTHARGGGDSKGTHEKMCQIKGHDIVFSFRGRASRAVRLSPPCSRTRFNIEKGRRCFVGFKQTCLRCRSSMIRQNFSIEVLSVLSLVYLPCSCCPRQRSKLSRHVGGCFPSEI